MGKKKTSRMRGVENKPLMQGMQGLRSSGAAGPHGDARDRRARTRSAAKGKAIRDSSEDGGAASPRRNRADYDGAFSLTLVRFVDYRD